VQLICNATYIQGLSYEYSKSQTIQKDSISG